MVLAIELRLALGLVDVLGSLGGGRLLDEAETWFECFRRPGPAGTGAGPDGRVVRILGPPMPWRRASSPRTCGRSAIARGQASYQLAGILFHR